MALQERNAARAGLGKDIDVEVLKTMIQRFEPYKEIVSTRAQQSGKSCTEIAAFLARAKHLAHL